MASTTRQDPLARSPHRGIRTAVTGVLLILGIAAAIAGLGSGVVWLLTGGFPPVQWTGRISLFGVVLGGAFVLCRLICGGGMDVNFTLRIAKGDLASLSGFLGVLLAGYLAQEVLPVASGDPASLAIGSAVEISGPTLDGGHFDLAEHRGKVVLVDFWATWCGPCIAELPHIREAYDQYHAQGLDVVGVNLDSRRSALVRFLKTTPLPWPQIFFDAAGNPNFQNPLAARFDIQTIPCLLVIDRDGKLVARDVRGKQMSTAVAAALGQPVAPSERIAGTAFQALGWMGYGVLFAPVWLVLVCGLGVATLAGLAEATVRRSFAQPRPTE